MRLVTYSTAGAGRCARAGRFPGISRARYFRRHGAGHSQLAGPRYRADSRSWARTIPPNMRNCNSGGLQPRDPACARPSCAANCGRAARASRLCNRGIRRLFDFSPRRRAGWRKATAAWRGGGCVRGPGDRLVLTDARREEGMNTLDRYTRRVALHAHDHGGAAGAGGAGPIHQRAKRYGCGNYSAGVRCCSPS